MRRRKGAACRRGREAGCRRGGCQAGEDRFAAGHRPRNDNEDHDTVALTALDGVLKLDAGNAVALQLREQISRYAAMKQERLAREAAAADRQSKIASLLATASATTTASMAAMGLWFWMKC